MGLTWLVASKGRYTLPGFTSRVHGPRSWSTFFTPMKWHLSHPLTPAVITGTCPHYPCSWAVFVGREHGCHFTHPCSWAHGPLTGVAAFNGTLTQAS